MLHLSQVGVTQLSAGGCRYRKRDGLSGQLTRQAGSTCLPGLCRYVTKPKEEGRLSYARQLAEVNKRPRSVRQ
jgi:hypothetical protein